MSTTGEELISGVNTCILAYHLNNTKVEKITENAKSKKKVLSLILLPISAKA